MTTTNPERQRGTWPHLADPDEIDDTLPVGLLFSINNQFRLPAVLKAAQSADVRGSQDPEHSRQSRIHTPHGTVKVHEKYDRWYKVGEVDMPPEHYAAFWQALKAQVDQAPDLMKFVPLGQAVGMRSYYRTTPTPEDFREYQKHCFFFRTEDIVAAADGASIQQGQDPHNTVQRLQMPQGAVYICIQSDKGGRAQVGEIDQPPADASQFLCKLRQLAADSDPRWTFKS